MSVKNNLKINIHRHSEGNVMTEESTAMYSNVMDPSVGVASLKDDNRAGQRGRSMVEMLGVLAIVGVLSVGGVYGYGVAMKKHKANELLHQASIHAATVSAQIMSGKEPTTLDTFADSNLGKFALDYDPTKTTFDLTISEMDSAVCTQLEKMAGGMVREVVCGAMDANGKTTATLTYYKNLATTVAEGAKSPTGGSSDTIDPLCKDVKCETGQQCIGGACAEVGACTGNCQNCVYDYEQEEEICEETIGCSQNSDCDDWCETNGGGEKCYCSINAEITDNDSACYKNFTGVCAVAEKRSGVTGGYRVSADSITWWSAVNFCKAHNKSLVSLSDLGITGGYQDDAYCERSECICGEEECTETFWSDLQDKLGSDYYLVTDAVSYDSDTGEYTSGTNNNSCDVFIVDLSSAVVVSNNRDNSLYQAHTLCE